MNVYCKVCRDLIAKIDQPKMVERPIRGGMFVSKDTYHGFPAPWEHIPNADWSGMTCPYCGAFPFGLPFSADGETMDPLGPKTFMTDNEQLMAFADLNPKLSEPEPAEEPLPTQPEPTEIDQVDYRSLCMDAVKVTVIKRILTGKDRHPKRLGVKIKRYQLSQQDFDSVAAAFNVPSISLDDILKKS